MNIFVVFVTNIRYDRSSAPWTIIRSPASQNNCLQHIWARRKNHFKASNYCTLRRMGLKVVKMKKKNSTNCKPELLQVLRQEQSHQFPRCGCCKMGNIASMLLGCFRILNLWRLAHASALTSSTFSSSSAVSSAVSSPINSPTYDFVISILSDRTPVRSLLPGLVSN